jgi:hypothetical protein
MWMKFIQPSSAELESTHYVNIENRSGFVIEYRNGASILLIIFTGKEIMLDDAKYSYLLAHRDIHEDISEDMLDELYQKIIGQIDLLLNSKVELIDFSDILTKLVAKEKNKRNEVM